MTVFTAFVSLIVVLPECSMQVERAFPPRAAAKRSCLLYPTDMTVCTCQTCSQPDNHANAHQALHPSSSPGRSLFLSVTHIAANNKVDGRSIALLTSTLTTIGFAFHSCRCPVTLSLFTSFSNFPPSFAFLVAFQSVLVHYQHERGPHRALYAQPARERIQQRPVLSDARNAQSQSTRVLPSCPKALERRSLAGPPRAANFC